RIGSRVPEQIAVVGIDGLEIGRLVTPELTTLTIDKAQLAAAAIRLLARILAGSKPAVATEATIGLTLLVRDSA
ncbi:substrate-binding domain-containing protein, partial [Agreia sp.]|uniref:substrate-binding domain-containing protein n=1 Tax=Agreia sp. TaxID=1872416 RepID=UPI0035BBF5B8